MTTKHQQRHPREDHTVNDPQTPEHDDDDLSPDVVRADALAAEWGSLNGTKDAAIVGVLLLLAETMADIRDILAGRP